MSGRTFHGDGLAGRLRKRTVSRRGMPRAKAHRSVDRECSVERAVLLLLAGPPPREFLRGTMGSLFPRGRQKKRLFVNLPPVVSRVGGTSATSLRGCGKSIFGGNETGQALCGTTVL